jgi:hypothetical protein
VIIVRLQRKVRAKGAELQVESGKKVSLWVRGLMMIRHAHNMNMTKNQSNPKSFCIHMDIIGGGKKQDGCQSHFQKFKFMQFAVTECKINQLHSQAIMIFCASPSRSPQFKGTEVRKPMELKAQNTKTLTSFLLLSWAQCIQAKLHLLDFNGGDRS